MTIKEDPVKPSNDDGIYKPNYGFADVETPVAAAEEVSPVFVPNATQTTSSSATVATAEASDKPTHSIVGDSTNDATPEETAENDGRSQLICRIIAFVTLLVSLVVVIATFARGSGDNTSSSNSSTSGGGYYGGSGKTSGSRGSSGGSCFPAGEMVTLLHNQRTPIDMLQPGQITQRGGKVEAVMKLLPTEGLYRYNNSVWVTGSHKVLERDQWMYIEQSKLAVQTVATASKRPEFLYNLITSTHQVVINNTIFSDWDEKDEPTEYAAQRFLAKINDNKVRREPVNADSTVSGVVVGKGAFAAGTLISTRTSQVPLDQVQPGHVLLNNGETVLATMKISVPSGTAIYSYESGTSSILMTEWTIVHHDGKWQYVRDCASGAHLEHILKSDEVFYQIITPSSNLAIEGKVFADHEFIL